MVVLGRREDERVEGCDLGRPCLRVIARVLAEDRRDRLVEQREIVILDVAELELGVAARARDLVDPASHGLALRSEEHTSELQSRLHLVCRLLLEKKKKPTNLTRPIDNARSH